MCNAVKATPQVYMKNTKNTAQGACQETNTARTVLYLYQDSHNPASVFLYTQA